MILKDINFVGSGKSAVHLLIDTPAQEVSSRSLVLLSWLETQDPSQQFYPKKKKKAFTKLWNFLLNVKETVYPSVFCFHGVKEMGQKKKGGGKLHTQSIAKTFTSVFPFQEEKKVGKADRNC